MRKLRFGRELVSLKEMAPCSVVKKRGWRMQLWGSLLEPKIDQKTDAKIDQNMAHFLVQKASQNESKNAPKIDQKFDQKHAPKIIAFLIKNASQNDQQMLQKSIKKAIQKLSTKKELQKTILCLKMSIFSRMNH